MKLPQSSPPCPFVPSQTWQQWNWNKLLNFSINKYVQVSLKVEKQKTHPLANFLGTNAECQSHVYTVMWIYHQRGFYLSIYIISLTGTKGINLLSTNLPIKKTMTRSRTYCNRSFLQFSRTENSHFITITTDQSRFFLLLMHIFKIYLDKCI